MKDASFAAFNIYIFLNCIYFFCETIIKFCSGIVNLVLKKKQHIFI